MDIMADLLEEDEFRPSPPDISHLVMEDGEPVDGTFSERQMRLLVDALYDSGVTSRSFVAQANVGVFYSVHEKGLVPDVFLSLDVTQRQDAFDRGRSYLIWEYGKAPDVVIEVVSNKIGGEMEKLEKYSSIGVSFVVIYDPQGHLSNRPLRVWGRHDRGYIEHAHVGWFPDLGLGFTTWTGSFQGLDGTWLRWCNQDGSLLLLGSERAEEERAKAAQERAKTEHERARAERLAARLRELGVEEV